MEEDKEVLNITDTPETEEKKVNSEDPKEDTKAESGELASENSMTDDELKASIEAILFAYGNSVECERIAEALCVSAKRVKKCFKALQKEYEDRKAGIRLLELEDSFQMCTATEHYEELIKLCHVPKKHKLTDVMLETLSIIAYKQPVTRQEIEAIRGVKSDFPINKLLEYNLIQELGRKEVPGRPVLFGTSEDFLRYFGISSAEELPDISPEKMEEFKKEAFDETNIPKELIEMNNL